MKMLIPRERPWEKIVDAAAGLPAVAVREIDQEPTSEAVNHPAHYGGADKQPLQYLSRTGLRLSD